MHVGQLRETGAHICVDMQRMFAEQTDWFTPWMERVRPIVHQIAESCPDRTFFTRFLPAERPGEGQGTWKRYYERWGSMTIERLGRERVDLLPELAALAPPAEVIDKNVYSPWMGDKLQHRLQARKIDTLVVSGAETDVCVLATVLGAVDRGYRVVVVTDALCSSSDETHDALLRLYRGRYGEQVETTTASEIIEKFRA